MAKRRRDSDSSDEDKKPVIKQEKDSESSSSSDDDAEWSAKGTSSKPKGKRGRPKKIKQEVEEEEKEEGEVEDDDEDEEDDLEEFNDGYDDNLMGDEEDQARLAQMTEKEREQELFNRSEKREVLRTRFEIEKKLRMAKKKEQSKLASDVAMRSNERRRNMEDKRKVKDAIKGLKAEREKKKQKQQRLRASDVYSSDSDSDDEKNQRRKTSSSSSSSSSDSSDESEIENKKIKDEDRLRDGDIDNQGSDKEEAEEWTISLEDLNIIRLSRHKLSKWCHAPFFKETVIGCFARIAIGLDPKLNTAVYRIAQICDVIETTKVYALGETRTNKVFRVKHGKDERIFRGEFISDSQFKEEEYQTWVQAVKNSNMDLPSKEFFESKKRHIQNALNYTFSENEIELIVQEKNKFNKRPVNFAVKKTQLLKEKEMAELNNDMEKVDRIMQELDELEEEAKRLDRERTKNIAAISYINERNRMRNIKEAERALAEASLEKSVNSSEDPFTRRKCTPTMIHMFNKNKQQQAIANETPVRAANQLTKNEPVPDIDNLIVDSNLIKSATSADNKPSSPTLTTQSSDLFSAHNFDIKIDFDVDFGIPAPASTSLSSNHHSGSNTSSSSSKPANRRSLNLDEYKKKKGLI